MCRLWEVEAERGSKLLQRETLTELGGATQIVQDHLEHAMADLSPGRRTPRPRCTTFSSLLPDRRSRIGHVISPVTPTSKSRRPLTSCGSLRPNGSFVRAPKRRRDSLRDLSRRARGRRRCLAEPLSRRARGSRAERRRRRAFGVATAALWSDSFSLAAIARLRARRAEPFALHARACTRPRACGRCRRAAHD